MDLQNLSVDRLRKHRDILQDDILRLKRELAYNEAQVRRIDDLITEKQLAFKDKKMLLYPESNQK